MCRMIFFFLFEDQINDTHSWKKNGIRAKHTHANKTLSVVHKAGWCQRQCSALRISALPCLLPPHTHNATPSPISTPTHHGHNHNHHHKRQHHHHQHPHHRHQHPSPIHAAPPEDSGRGPPQNVGLLRRLCGRGRFAASRPGLCFGFSESSSHVACNVDA